MVIIGLTGGIGSGKSTVAALLAERGARVIDADRIGHEAYLPGTPGWDQIVAAFGRDVVAADGTIDRAALGRRVFADREALETLNRIVHPLIAQEIQALGAMPKHPNVVDVYDAQQVGDNHFYVMELIDGADLTKLVQAAGPMRIPDACEAIRQAEGTSVVVGVNRYANEGDVSIPVLEVDPALEEEQRRRLAVWRAGRDQGSVEAALADLGDQAKTSGNLLYPIKEALRVGATVGEVSNRLREVFGVYRPG